MASRMTLEKHVSRPDPLGRACGIVGLESELQLAQPFLFGLSGVFHQVEAYMESIRYKCPLFILDQGGIVALQDGLVAYLSHYKSWSGTCTGRR
jgi:hypothetical protein